MKACETVNVSQHVNTKKKLFHSKEFHHIRVFHLKRADGAVCCVCVLSIKEEKRAGGGM